MTSATSADGKNGGKIDAANDAEDAKCLDFIMPMTYDYFGTWDAKFFWSLDGDTKDGELISALSNGLK